MARLRGEILEKVGPTDMPSPDDIKDMKYLRAVINGGRLLCHSIAITNDGTRDVETLSNCVCRLLYVLFV